MSLVSFPPREGHFPIEKMLKDRMIGAVLPFWADKGLDPKTGLCFERLLPDSQPDRAAPLRVRVQFRQIYCFSHAAVLGWLPEGAQIALGIWQATLDAFWKRDGGFVHLLSPEGEALNADSDSYDHAFAVLALSWLARATGDAQVRSHLESVLAYVDNHMTDSQGALLEGVPHRLPRRQNPQMHWFEAMLAMQDALAHPQALHRAGQARSLFTDRLYHRESGTLGEFFAQDWSDAPGIKGGSVEPGHQAEWTWLLRSHERLAGLPPDPLASQLLESALRCADPHTGLLVDETDRQLRVRRGTRRSWLQTELCKAWIAEAEVGRPGAREKAVQALEVLDFHYMGKPFPCGWIDQLDEAARPIRGPVPASILYHILVAVIEADRVIATA